MHRGRHLANPGRLYSHPHRSSVHVHVPRLRPVIFADGRWEARVAESGSISGVREKQFLEAFLLIHIITLV